MRACSRQCCCCVKAAFHFCDRCCCCCCSFLMQARLLRQARVAGGRRRGPGRGALQLLMRCLLPCCMHPSCGCTGHLIALGTDPCPSVGCKRRGRVALLCGRACWGAAWLAAGWAAWQRSSGSCAQQTAVAAWRWLAMAPWHAAAAQTAAHTPGGCGSSGTQPATDRGAGMLAAAALHRPRL